MAEKQFVSSFGKESGTVETVSLRPVGDRLVVNADASKGRVAVEVLDQAGNILPGYSAQDCILLQSDAIRHTFNWKDRNRLPVEQPIRLRFHLRNAKLYSYCVKSTD